MTLLKSLTTFTAAMFFTGNAFAQPMLDDASTLTDLMENPHNNLNLSLGYNENMGPNASKTLNAALDWTSYSNDQLRHFYSSYYIQDGEYYPKEQVSYEFDLMYDITEISTFEIVALAKFNGDNYSAHELRKTYGLGIGKNWVGSSYGLTAVGLIVNNDLTFSSEVSSGFSQDPEHLTANVRVTFNKNLTDSLSFEQHIDYSQSFNDNSTWFMKSVSSINQIVSENLSLGLTYELDYRSHSSDFQSEHKDSSLMMSINYSIY